MRLLTGVSRAAAIAAACAVVVAGPAPARSPLNIGFVYVSPIGDVGWTFQHDAGRKQMEKALAGKVVTRVVENVPEGADAERVIRELASTGSQLVFTTSFGYMNPTIRVARQFPNVAFEHASGYKTETNVGIYNARFYEGRYLNGVIAGRMSKTNLAGYVAAFPIPEVLQGINAFTLGMRSVNPEAEVRVVWVDAWFDPGREREAANTLISQGADVVTHHTESPAVVHAAEEKGVYAFGYHSDMSGYGPKAHLSATIHQWGDYYTRVAQQMLAGTWRPGSFWGGMKEGMIRLAPLNPAVPTEVGDLVTSLGNEIIAGRLHPFRGPIKDNAGKEQVASGMTMDDAALAKMNFYVEGVQGRLPSR